MTALAAAMLSLAGFAALALATARHHDDLFGRRPTRRTALATRAAACLSLATSAGAAVRHSGAAIGVVLWFGLATISVLAVALLLAYPVRRWPPGGARG